MHRPIARLALAAAVATIALSVVAWPAAAHADPPADESGEGQGHLQYPATAAVFRAHVNDRITAARGRLEQHIADHQIEPQKADALRARFQAAIAQLNAKVDEVCADGTVTHDEALAVHELAKELRHHPKPA